METFSWLKLQLCRSGILYYNNSPKAKSGANIENCVVLAKCMFLSSTTGYYMMYTAKTNNEFVLSSIYLISFLLVTLWYSLCVWYREKIETLFIDLDAIIEKRSERDAAIKIIYEITDRNAVTLAKQFHKIFNQILVPIFIITPILTSIIKFIRSDFSNESLQLIFPATFPFDWKTPVGYLACVWIQAIVTLTVANIYSTVIAMIFSLCSFATSFVLDLEKELTQFREDMDATDYGKYSPRQIIKLKKRLGDFIDFHGEARGLATRISDITGNLINVYLMYVITIFGSVSLSMNSSIKSGNIAQIVQMSFILLTVLPLLYSFCHFGEEVTSRFEALGDKVYQLNWYTLPLDMQKDLVRVIAISQKRIFVRGYAHIHSTREVFRRILRNKLSFLLVIRKF